MARMPGAVQLDDHSFTKTEMSRYDIVCVHTIVGFAPAHAAHFSTKANGTILQSRDTRWRSAANLNGNHRVLSIENEDFGEAFGKMPRALEDWPPLTPEQVEACAQILAWAHLEHGVPLQLAPDSRPGSRGLAYHRQGIDGNFGPGTAYPARGRVDGGEVWSSSGGKVCPGDARINQLPAILARAKEIVNPKEDYMATEAAERKLDQALAALEKLNTQFKTFRENEVDRDKHAAALERARNAAAIARLDSLLAATSNDPTRAQVAEIRDLLVAEEAS